MRSVCELVSQHWVELRAIEVGVDEAAQEFDGDNPLQPETRAAAQRPAHVLQEIRDSMKDYVALEFAEPPQEAQVRLLVETAARPGKAR